MRLADVHGIRYVNAASAVSKGAVFQYAQ